MSDEIKNPFSDESIASKNTFVGGFPYKKEYGKLPIELIKKCDSCKGETVISPRQITILKKVKKLICTRCLYKNNKLEELQTYDFPNEDNNEIEKVNPLATFLKFEKWFR